MMLCVGIHSYHLCGGVFFVKSLIPVERVPWINALISTALSMHKLFSGSQTQATLSSVIVLQKLSNVLGSQ